MPRITVKLARRIPQLRALIEQRDGLLVQLAQEQAEIDRLEAENNDLLDGRELYHDERDILARRDVLIRRYIPEGSFGLEIGALHIPVPLPGIDVKYVDRMTVDELREQYPELDHEELIEPNIVDDGETLATVPDDSQDFLIANHFLEHCEDPIRALSNFLRVVKPGGVVCVSVPDKRYTFDKDRPLTDIQHLVKDHESGTDTSRLDHFREHVRLVEGIKDKNEAEKRVKRLDEIDYSIHYHVWTVPAFIDFLSYLRNDARLGFEEEVVLKNYQEAAAVLRKI